MDPLPLSLLNDFLYCPRRAALKEVEGWREANYETDRGDIVHEHADLAGYEVAKGVTLLRALPVWSERLGLNGKCDIVEVRGGAAGIAGGKTRNPRGEGGLVVPSGFDALFPVEFKVGRRRQFENDDVQVCAQALCLEEMFGQPVPRGAIFHADSKRRREVEFTADLRALTERTVDALRQLLEQGQAPPAHYVEGRCEKCSLFEVCLPRLTDACRKRPNAAELFQT